MSWQDYVDNQLIASQCVSKACIAGHDGGVWAKSEGFEVSLGLSMMQSQNISQFLAAEKVQKFRTFSSSSSRRSEKAMQTPAAFLMSIARTRPSRDYWNDELNALWDSHKDTAIARMSFVTTFFLSIRRLGVSDFPIHGVSERVFWTICWTLRHDPTMIRSMRC